MGSGGVSVRAPCLLELKAMYPGRDNRALMFALKDLEKYVGGDPIASLAKEVNLLRSAEIPPKPQNPARATNSQGINERM